jgi:DNA-binding transcriptional LysR family regulator
LLPTSVRFRLLVGILCLILAPGCQPTNTPAPQPASIIRVELSSTLKYLSPAIQACTLQESGLHVILDEKPASQMGKIDADVSIRWGDANMPSPSHVFRLGSDRLVLAAHKNNPLKVIEISQAVYLLSGGIPTWGDIIDKYCPQCTGSDEFRAQPLEVWRYTNGEDISLEIAQIPAINQTVNLNRIFLAPSSQSMAEAISNNTAAIGLLPSRWLNENIKEIALQGVNPTEFIIPVLASTPSDPNPVVHDWLICLQSTYNN